MASTAAAETSSKDIAAASPPAGAVVYSRDAQSGPGMVVRDLVDGLRLGPVWRAFAWDEIQQRYRRSAIGLAWIAISYLIFVGAIALFFSDFSTLAAKHFTYYVAIGYAAFSFLVGNLVDGCDVFRNSQTWIKSAQLPYSIYIYKSIARSLFPFAVQVAVALIFMAAAGWRPTASIAMALPAIALYVVNAVAVQWVFGLLASRFRDVTHLVGAVTKFLFFTTPIMWVYSERSGLVKDVVDFNPFTHFIEIFRAPILGDAMVQNSWPAALFVTALMWVCALVAAGLLRRRVPFWI